ncbi:MAG TPA: DUF5681 domain-containing protein [Verrucomicrobiae bacterium]|jgi:hypothetical protein|nr:DUF5681 domain-containing protein [Verrucomicrobiae bacterium]
MERDDFEVGFGKPPKRTQFRKGASGNPQGRPKGSRNVGTVLAKILQEKTIVNENGKRKGMTKFDAVIRQLVNKALRGDMVASRLLFSLASSTEVQSTDLPARQLTEPDFKVLQTILERLEESSKETVDEPKS